MTIRFISQLHTWPALLAGLLLSASTLALAQAQEGAAAALPAAPMAAVPAPTQAPAAYRSALEGYQPYSDEQTVDWKNANDTVGRIGGWREYAKEAQQLQTPAPAAQPTEKLKP